MKVNSQLIRKIIFFILLIIRKLFARNFSSEYSGQWPINKENLKSDLKASWTFQLAIFLFIQVPLLLFLLLMTERREKPFFEAAISFQFSKSNERSKSYVCIDFQIIAHDSEKGKIRSSPCVWSELLSKQSQAFISRSA